MLSNTSLRPGGRIIIFLLSAGLAACSSEPKSTPPVEPPPPSTSQHVPIGQLPAIDANALLAHTKVLSSDEFEGRAPGHEGRRADGQLPHRPVQEGRPQAGQHRRHLHSEGAAGRHHAGAGAAACSRKARQQQTLKWKDDVVAWTKHVADTREPRQLRAGVRRLRRRGAGVQLGRLQRRRRQGQDARDARQRSAGARSGERVASSIRRRSAARR